MIEICSMNAIVDFLRLQSKIVYRLYLTRNVIEDVFLADS